MEYRQGSHTKYKIEYHVLKDEVALRVRDLVPNIVIAGVCVLIGHIGGSIQWIFSTTLLHRLIDHRFRGRVFAAEMALLTLVLSFSTWLTGVALDRGVDPRTIVVWLALLFLLPGSTWLLYFFRFAGRLKK